MAINKNIYSIIKSPLITEKSTRNSAYRQYVFSVDTRANKIDIRKAIEKIYNVKVEKISSLIVKGRMKRLRGNQSGKTTAWKKAIITLKEGNEIKIT